MNKIDFDVPCFKKSDIKFVKALKAIMWTRNLTQSELADLLECWGLWCCLWRWLAKGVMVFDVV